VNNPTIRDYRNNNRWLLPERSDRTTNTIVDEIGTEDDKRFDDAENKKDRSRGK
jgi:hypothetical protein